MILLKILSFSLSAALAQSPANAPNAKLQTPSSPLLAPCAAVAKNPFAVPLPNAEKLSEQQAAAQPCPEASSAAKTRARFDAPSLESLPLYFGEAADGRASRQDPARAGATPLPWVSLGLTWNQAHGDINAKGVMTSVQARIPKLIPNPQKYGYLSASVNLFAGYETGVTAAYRENGIDDDNLIRKILPTADDYADRSAQNIWCRDTLYSDPSQCYAFYEQLEEHSVTKKKGAAIYPWFQLNYHAPTFWGRVKPSASLLFSRVTRDDTQRTWNVLEGHYWQEEDCDYYDYESGYCSYSQDTYTVHHEDRLSSVLASEIAGEAWKKWALGVGAAVDVELVKKTAGRAAFSLRGEYRRYLGREGTNVWGIGPVFSW